MKGMVFDCDGVLVDSERWSCSAWLPVLARHGIEARLADIEAFIGKSDRALVEHFRQRTGIELPPGAIDEREQEYFALARGRLRTFPGLREVLGDLAAWGTPLAVASSGRLAKIRFSLRETGLDGYFGVVCSADEVSHGKPAPDLFLLAAGRLGLPPRDCIVVEDSVYGIQAARSAGMRALALLSSYAPAALTAAGADACFSAYSELLPLLQRGAG